MSAKNKTYLLVSPDFPPPFIGGSLVYMHNLINNSKLDFDVLTTSGNRCDQENIRFIESSYIVGSNDPGSVRLLKMYAYLVLNLMRMKQYEVVVLNVSTVGNGLLVRCLRWLGV